MILTIVSVTSLKNINLFVIIIDIDCVFCDVETEAYMHFRRTPVHKLPTYIFSEYFIPRQLCCLNGPTLIDSWTR